MAQRILVVDDEPSIREVVSLYLKREGYNVREAADGDEALKAAFEFAPDLIVLDLMLPKKDGMEVFRTLSVKNPVPVIMLTARGEETDRIVGLTIGADDYVTKPFSPAELVARVKAVLRRAGTSEAQPVDPAARPLIFPGLTIDPRSRSVLVNGEEVTLTATEFDLLHELARHPGQVFTREQLLDRVWDEEFYGDASTVTVHIRRLRQKIEPEPDNPKYVQTVWGVGYRFRAPKEQST
jgi:DNA-binding response OmpR family regulator